MRDPRIIASEIDRARADLELRLGELKALVHDMLDLKLRARRAVERRVDEAQAAIQRARASARRHPAIAAIAACAVIALIYVAIRARRDRG